MSILMGLRPSTKKHLLSDLTEAAARNDEWAEFDRRLLAEVAWVQEQSKLPAIDRTWDQETYFASSRIHAIKLLSGDEFDAYYCPDCARDNLTMKQIAERNMHIALLTEHVGPTYCLAGHVFQQVCEAGGRIDGSPRHIAMHYLALNEFQADTLFRGSNTVKGIEMIAQEIISSRRAA